MTTTTFTESRDDEKQLCHLTLIKNARILIMNDDEKILIVPFFPCRKVMNKQEVFQAVYETFQNHDFEASTYDDLRNSLKKKLDAVDPKDLCYNLVNQILQVI